MLFNISENTVQSLKNFFPERMNLNKDLICQNIIREHLYISVKID